MIQINNTYYELDIIDIITELKNQLSIENVNLFNQIKELPEDIMVSCPFHKDGQERKPSCGIRKKDGWLHCFTCGESCSIEQLISRCFGKDDFGQYGLNWLKNNFLGDILQERNISIDLTRDVFKANYTQNLFLNGKYVQEEELNKYRYYHPYMYERKMTNEVIEIFDIGYDVDTDCLTFPVRDKEGNCLFVARRSVTSKYFNYPTSVEKPIYGIYELNKYAPKDLDEIIVCESMINCITVWVYGRFAIALNGTGSSSQLKELINLPYRKIILALDPDEAGEKGTQKIFNKLKNYKLVTKLVIPKGKDINDISKEEFDNLQEVFI